MACHSDPLHARNHPQRGRHPPQCVFFKPPIRGLVSIGRIRAWLDSADLGDACAKSTGCHPSSRAISAEMNTHLVRAEVLTCLPRRGSSVPSVLMCRKIQAPRIVPFNDDFRRTTLTTRLLILVSVVAAFSSTMNARCKDSVVGTWKLLSVTATDEKGDVDKPVLGHHPSGLLTYTANGRMMAIISDDGRKPLSIADRVAAPADERAEAYSHLWPTQADTRSPATRS